MERAIELSGEGMRGGQGGPFGAVIARDGQIVAEGVNRVTSSHDPTAHAEVVAIRAACSALGGFSLAGCEIYSSCEPCPMCLSAICWARLDRLTYGATRHDAAAIGFDDARLYEELQRDPAERSLDTRQLARDEAARLMRGWLALPPDRHY
jgi:tRNA(Arg) A34 adenosine deaminase TadA